MLVLLLFLWPPLAAFLLLLLLPRRLRLCLRLRLRLRSRLRLYCYDDNAYFRTSDPHTPTAGGRTPPTLLSWRGTPASGRFSCAESPLPYSKQGPCIYSSLDRGGLETKIILSLDVAVLELLKKLLAPALSSQAKTSSRLLHVRTRATSERNGHSFQHGGSTPAFQAERCCVYAAIFSRMCPCPLEGSWAVISRALSKVASI